MTGVRFIMSKIDFEKVNLVICEINTWPCSKCFACNMFKLSHNGETLKHFKDLSWKDIELLAKRKKNNLHSKNVNRRKTTDNTRKNKK